MEWIFRIFFGVMALCCVIAGIYWIKNLLSRQHRAKAVVKHKSRKKFPVSVGSIRKDRAECKLVFFLPEEQREVTFDVSEKLFDRFPVGTVGQLTWQGSWMREFRPISYPKTAGKKSDADPQGDKSTQGMAD